MAPGSGAASAGRCMNPMEHVQATCRDMGWNRWSGYAYALRMTVQVIAESTITCPSCSTSKIETMPTDACQFFYDCTGCGTLSRPKSGDCCVFFSFGTAPLPPIQEGGGKAACCV